MTNREKEQQEMYKCLRKRLDELQEEIDYNNRQAAYIEQSLYDYERLLALKAESESRLQRAYEALQRCYISFDPPVAPLTDDNVEWVTEK